MTRTLLMTGSTGSVSTALREALTDSDLELRALIRDPAQAPPLQEQGVEAVLGDLDDPRSLPEAFEAVQDLWLLVPNGPRAPEHSMNAVWAARQAGVERVVRLSAIGAAHDAPTRSGRLHALSDRELQDSGMSWTVLRPCWFMQNLLNEAGDIAARGTFALNAGDAGLGMIDVRDIAEVAAQVLRSEPAEHDGKTYTLTGPQALTFTDVAERLTRILGKPITYTPVSDDARRKTLLDYQLPSWIVDMLIEYAQAYGAGWGDYTTKDVLDVVGRPPRDLDAFIRDHVAAFS